MNDFSNLLANTRHNRCWPPHRCRSRSVNDHDVPESISDDQLQAFEEFLDNRVVPRVVIVKDFKRLNNAEAFDLFATGRGEELYVSRTNKVEFYFAGELVWAMDELPDGETWAISNLPSGTLIFSAHELTTTRCKPTQSVVQQTQVGE